MKTSATVLADSINESGIRLTTLQVTFPRPVLVEFNTHRVMSRNFRSSRAVPVKKLIEEVRTDPFIPVFRKNKPGMQAGDLLDEREAHEAEECWRHAALDACLHAELLADLGTHKQYANRLLEPFVFVHGVISATNWENFFTLRCHGDADPAFQDLANAVNAARSASIPYPLHVGDWHLPYVTQLELRTYTLEVCKQLSAARCAWVSYTPYDSSTDTDLVKVERTISKLLSNPMHASPFEHQATPGNTHPCNYVGWVQLRHLIEEESKIV